MGVEFCSSLKHVAGDTVLQHQLHYTYVDPGCQLC